MGNELLKATTQLPYFCKLEKYLQRRAIIKDYSEACLSDLAPALEGVELEKATLTLTFKDSESVEKFNESKDGVYLPRFREIYLDAKRMIERLGIEAHFHFTNIEAKIKPIKDPLKRTIFYTKKPRPINMDLTNHTDFTRKVFAKMIQANNERYFNYRWQ
ncbi:hypothetical protein KVE23_06765 [Helicobacter pylori]|nr:hypothetical protein KVE23_06765 [Helicobacter pylori]